MTAGADLAAPGCAARLARQADLAELVRLEQACLADPWNRDFLAFEIGCLEARVLVTPAAGGESLTGYAIFRLLGPDAELLRLGVDPAHRRHGLGAAVVRAGLARLQEEGVSACFLEVRATNAAARALYRRLGFREVGRRRAYYPDGSDALVLSLGLASAAAGPP